MSALMLGVAITISMAPTGHASAQSPWPMHLDPLTIAAFPPITASTSPSGQTSTQAAAADAVGHVDVRVLRPRTAREELPRSAAASASRSRFRRAPEVQDQRADEKEREDEIDQQVHRCSRSNGSGPAPCKAYGELQVRAVTSHRRSINLSTMQTHRLRRIEDARMAEYRVTARSGARRCGSQARIGSPRCSCIESFQFK